MEIKVLGAGCAKCKKLEQNLQIAIEKTGVIARVTKVEDISQIMEYKVMITPALVINEEVVSKGRILSAKEIAKLLI